MSATTVPDPVALLRTLVRFDTTNPPGHEIECIRYIDGLLQAAGFQTTILAKDPQRPNLIARLTGRGDAPGLVLQGHVDVVTTVGQDWTHPPFDAVLEDGWIWGRGSLDMKSGVVMMLNALLRARAQGMTPAGDIILTVLSDEEAGSDYGARFLTESHPEQFEGARYAIGEGGGFLQEMDGRRYYTCMVAEKGICWMKATVRGPGGHGSMPKRDGAMARLGEILTRLNQARLPVHITPVMTRMLTTIAEAAPSSEMASYVDGLLDPARTDETLDRMAADGVQQARLFDAQLHNTVNATVVTGGFKTNVIPSVIELELDGRILPGFTFDEMAAEVRGLLGQELAAQVELEPLRHDPNPDRLDMGLFPLFRELIAQAEPDAVLLPTMAPGFTDGRMFTRLGIQNYGFLPMRLPPEADLFTTVHGADERIPVDALTFGCETFYRLVERYGAE